MTEVTHAKPPAPILTRALQLLGLAAVVVGVQTIVDAADCQELDCLAMPLGVLMVGYGVVALLSGLRGTAGLVFLIATLVIPLLVLWVKFLIGLGFLVAVMILTRLSKERLAAYYRSREPSK